MKNILVVILVVLCTACAPNYSEGERVGVITKFSNKGLVFKSWEGSINQGGTKVVTDSEGRSSVVPNAIGFNVSDPEIVKKVKEAANTGQRVKVTYSQWFMQPVTIENPRVITKVEYLDE